MTPAKVRQVIRKYQGELTFMGALAKRYPGETVFNLAHGKRALDHCLWMLGEMDTFVREGRMEKTFRWLGFVQGVLWSQGIASIDQMKEHNRP